MVRVVFHSVGGEGLEALGAAWPESTPVAVGVGGAVPLVHLLG
ncbi:hypothetical protein [Nocardioides albus]|uniref:Uncharacterized protein n=1 Tax=Nocardioides albus TaxID=1841 RepID=A0A7W5A9I6_9ACTN|nr:hypothetical protein [Nocardioides albus]MBB3092103.1 hypothetical protein [Nocardioides albus]